MPNISIYVNDDDAEWLADNIGKGNISPYLQELIHKDKGRVQYLRDKDFFEAVMNLGIFFLGLSFILLVMATSFLPGIGSLSYVIPMLAGGTLIIMQSFLKFYHKRKVKNGLNIANNSS